MTNPGAPQTAPSTCVVIGIDVAKAWPDGAVRPTRAQWRLGTNDTAIAALVEQLRALTPQLIVLEASPGPAGYKRLVTAQLAGAALPVAVVNPRQVRDFARATGPVRRGGASRAAPAAR